jgi:hypothetical protein
MWRSQDVGRITPRWRAIYHRQIDRWRNRNRFYHALREAQRQDAFNHLLRVWGRESAAPSNANLPCVIDAHDLMANVDAERCLETLRAQATDVTLRLRALDREHAP